MKKFKLLLFTFMLGAIVVCVWPYLPPIQLGPPRQPIRLMAGDRDVKTDFELHIRELSPSMRMVVASVHEQVYASRSDDSWWWGDLSVRADSPVRLTYSIDLAQAECEWNAARQLLTMRVPDVAVEAVETGISIPKRQVEAQGWCRWKSEADELGLSAEREIPRAARALAESPHLTDKARLVGLPSLRAALLRVLHAVAGPDALIEIYVTHPRPTP